MSRLLTYLLKKVPPRVKLTASGKILVYSIVEHFSLFQTALTAYVNGTV